VGIIASLFTAIFVSRLIFDFFLGRRQVDHLSI
jgi:preprotein translocase subunit SecD